MKVIFDISPVNSNPSKNTGLARVALSTAISLREILGEQVSFSACGSISAALEAENLLQAHPEFLSALAPLGSSERYLIQLQEQLSKEKTNLRDLKKFGYDISSKFILNLQRIQNILRSPINSEKLRKADIFHSSYARIPRQVRRKTDVQCIITVYDLIPLILNNKYFAPGQKNITSRIINSIHPDDWVTTISKNTRIDLLNYNPNLSPDKVVAIPLAASPDIFYQVQDKSFIAKAKKKYKIPNCPYFLSLHSMAPHKNVSHLIHCFIKFVEQENISDLKLVLSGGGGRRQEDIKQELGIDKNYSQYVHFTGYVEDTDLAALYSGALGFVFPSLYEGFGLPVLEAMQCGCPVIASNTSSIPEIVGNAGLLVDPKSVDGLCDAILKLYRSQSLSSELAKRSLERADLYSWQKMARDIQKLYSRILYE